METTLKKLSGRIITWSGNVGAIDASELPEGQSTMFEVVSHRTGRSELFTLTGVQRDREGEVLSWLQAPRLQRLRGDADARLHAP